MKFSTTVAILLLLFSWGCKSKSHKAADDIASKVGTPATMNVGKRLYSIDVPEGWTTENVNKYGVDYFFLRAPKTAEDPNTSINIITEDMQNHSLEDYREKTIEAVQNAIPSANLLSKGNIIANGIEGAWYSYSMEPEGIEATLVCYIFPIDGIAYVVTAGTQTNDAESYRALFDSVARSFKLDDVER